MMQCMANFLLLFGRKMINIRWKSFVSAKVQRGCLHDSQEEETSHYSFVTVSSEDEGELICGRLKCT